ncbi:MAG: cupin domain-containing protein [Pseudomonadota bacterium]
MPFYLSRADINAMPEQRTQHQFNANAVRHTRNLTTASGLERIGIHISRIEPGHDSTTHHYHDADEEFLYILSGRGVARIGDETFEVGPGDFMGFPVPSPAHSLHNPFDEDLVYLMGGERWAVDVVHYPDIHTTMIKSHGRRYFTQDENLAEVDR